MKQRQASCKVSMFWMGIIDAIVPMADDANSAELDKIQGLGSSHSHTLF